MKEIEEYIQLETLVTSQSSYMDLIKTAPNRRRTLIAAIVGFGAQWNGIGVVSYYLTLVLNTIGITTTESKALINGLLQVFNFIVAVFAGALMVDRIGRRTLFLISTGGLCLSYIAWTALTAQYAITKSTGMANAVVAFIFLSYMFYDIAWTPLLQAYPVEIFPYTLRGRGLSVTLMSSYIGLIIGQFLNPIALNNLEWRYYIVFCCILAILFALIWFLFPETKGHTLEEIAEIFDGKRVVAIQAGLKEEGETSVEHDEKRVGMETKAVVA
jgi:MFS family permease